MSAATPAAGAGQRVLVTGAAGFIGRALCQSLQRQGAQVHAVSRRAVPPGDDGVRWHVCDLSDDAATDRLLARVRPAVAYGLTGRVTGSRHLDEVPASIRDTLLPTVTLLTAAARHAVPRVVLAGSMEEPDPGLAAAPSSPYAAAKWSAAGYGAMFAELYGLAVVNLRIFMAYGPGFQDPRKVVPHVILSVLGGQRPRIGSAGRLIDWVYLDDVVAALAAAGDAAVPAGARIEIGSGEPLPLGEFARRLATTVDPGAGVDVDGPARPLEREAGADVRAAAQLLGWHPRVGLDEGLRRVVAWYRRRHAEGAFDDAAATGGR